MSPARMYSRARSTASRKSSRAIEERGTAGSPIAAGGSDHASGRRRRSTSASSRCTAASQAAPGSLPPRAWVTTFIVWVRLSNTLTTSPNMNTASGSPRSSFVRSGTFSNQRTAS